MSKVVYNSSSMLNYTQGHVKNCISSLNKAVTNCQNMIIPSDFGDIQYLKKLSSNIKDNVDSLTNLNNWIVDNNSKYTSIVKEIEDNIRDVDAIVVKKRKGYISQG